MIKRFVAAVIGVFVLWSAVDFIVHGLVLQSTYEATAQLWRPMAEMKMGLMHVVTLVAVGCFVGIFTLFVHPKGLCRAVGYGLLYGVGGGISMGLGTYAFMPIPLYLGVVWFLTFLGETLAGGLLVGLIVKEPVSATETPT
ncbi:MAG: hypothetical protein AB1646_17385 [Thermodesulfobacteriota bacterium]